METSIFAARLTRELSESERRILSDALPPERRARFLRLRAPSGGAEILCAYALLRWALREKLGWLDLPEIALSERGKPYFPAFPGVQFNLSHADGAVMVGLSPAPIGVDIENARPVKPRLMRRVSADTPDAFFRAWVAMEAVGKRDGRGVAPVLRGGVDPLADAGYSPLETWPGYFAGYALSPGRELVETRLLSADEIMA